MHLLLLFIAVLILCIAGIAASDEPIAPQTRQISYYFNKNDKPVAGSDDWVWKRTLNVDKDDKPLGEITDYWRNGKLKAKGLFEKGFEDGKWVFYHDNGVKEKEGLFKRGMLQGKWSFWYPSGRLDKEGEFKDDLSVGTWVFYHENGIKKAEGMFLNGVAVRHTWSFWNQNGKPEKGY